VSATAVITGKARATCRKQRERALARCKRTVTAGRTAQQGPGRPASCRGLRYLVSAGQDVGCEAGRRGSRGGGGGRSRWSLRGSERRGVRRLAPDTYTAADIGCTRH
jgi:hypothetical protein